MKFRPKKVNFKSDEEGRRPKASADERLAPRNMKDWGCTDDYIREPRYSDRAYELCSQVGNEDLLKIRGQIHDVRTPTLLAKARLHKDAFQSPDRLAATPGNDRADFKVIESKSRPFVVGRKKQRE